MPENALSAAQLLADARQIISDPNAWTQGTIARSAAGHPLAAQHKDAASWCATGALACALHRRLRTKSPPKAAHLARDHAIHVLNDTIQSLTAGHHKKVSTYNDTTNHGCMLHTFDIAIADARLPATIAPSRLAHTP